MVVSDWGLCTSASSLWKYEYVQQLSSDWPELPVKSAAKNNVTSGFKVINRTMGFPGSKWIKVESDFDNSLSQIKQSFTHVGTCKTIQKKHFFKSLPGFIKDIVRGAGVATHVGQDPVTVPVGIQQGSHNAHYAGQALNRIHQSIYGRRPRPSQCSPRRAGPNNNLSINLWTTPISFASNRAVTMLTTQGRP